MKKKIFALALAAVMLVSGAMTAMAATPVTVKNAAWWDAWSPSYELKDGATLEFDVDLAKGGAGCFNNLNAVFATVATDGTKAPSADNFTGYAEYAVIRSDFYGWGNEYANVTAEGDNFYTGEGDYTAKNTGAHYDVVIARSGNTVTYTLDIVDGTGAKYHSVRTMKATDLSAGCHVFFTGDAGVEMTITPVEKAAENPDVPAKGDMSSVMTYVVLFFGAALVVVAARKRFA